MSSFFLRPLRQLGQTLVANDSPRQIAVGFTLGMLIGLLPKENLLVMTLATCLCALRVNKPAGVLAAGIFTGVGLLFDGLAHKLGALVLIWEPARPVHTWLYELPLGPWFGCNNTVVVGQLLIGLYLAYPTYWCVLSCSRHFQPRVSRWLLRYRVVRWLRGAEFGTQWGTEV